MASIPDLDAVLGAALKADSGVSAIVSGRVYALRASAGAVFPYITFDAVTEQVLNITPRASIDWFYRVHSWAGTGAQCASLHQAVYAALHGQHLTITNWRNHRTTVLNGVRLVDNSSGSNFYHFVWDVRIQATENTVGS